MPRKRLDLSNRKMGKLLVLYHGENIGKNTTWVCKCDCGNYTVVRTIDLTTNNTKSCGCGSSRNTIGERTKTHGLRNTKQYGVWCTMNSRCKNVNDKYYGGKGIKVLWNSFEEFWDDMGDAYKSGLTIDRINSDGDYCKDNCRWVERAEQNRNKSDNVMITYNGETLPLKTMCNKYSIDYKKAHYRYRYRGLSFEQILNILR